MPVKNRQNNKSKYAQSKQTIMYFSYNYSFANRRYIFSAVVHHCLPYQNWIIRLRMLS